MSVIHEAIKRAREARRAPDKRPAVTVKSSGSVPAWVWWVMLFVVLGEGGLYWSERARRLHSEDKMRMAYLELNDSRGEYLQKSETARRSASELRELRTKLDEALRVKAEVLKAKEAVEYDNLDKEKKVSQLTKSTHELEMSRFQLQAEIRALEAKVAKASSATVPAEQASSK